LQAIRACGSEIGMREEARGTSLPDAISAVSASSPDIEPLHIAAYIEALQDSTATATVKPATRANRGFPRLACG
jgi:hypothetical protein